MAGIYRDAEGREVYGESQVAVGGSLSLSETALTPKGYQQLTNDNLATSQALTVPTGATSATIQNNGSQPARFRDDGVAPTSSAGQRIPAGEAFQTDRGLSALRFIREADGVTLDIAYYG